MSPRDATESDRNGDHEIRPFQSQKSCLEHDYPFVNRVVGKRGVRLYLSQSVRLGQKDFAVSLYTRSTPVTILRLALLLSGPESWPLS